ncbi:hypothetical protein SteCoe_31846 [Stentor coeruleus]|uniref:Transcription factor CBF/NF-Y/archaeal histone domain-containing protein n=1 Tax=Stentor coeruleus TaxID=5963 RepID=A0A1R2B0F4_9CILI|nr:hypothetical protein SteCoe_31846 [Stentor coeruleus]
MESDIALPKATIKQLIQKSISPIYKSSASGITDIIADLSHDFIAIISEKSFEECQNNGKKTIIPEHVISAMTHLNFAMDSNEITTFLEELEKLKALKPKEQLKLKKHGVSEDQLLEEQEKLFASANEFNLNIEKKEILEEDKEDYD